MFRPLKTTELANGSRGCVNIECIVCIYPRRHVCQIEAFRHMVDGVKGELNIRCDVFHNFTNTDIMMIILCMCADEPMLTESVIEPHSK